MAECTLCGADIGRNTRSREHVFAKWIRDLFPDAERSQQTRKTQVRGGRMEVERWEDVPLNLLVKDVCKPCNNEWCQEIDDEAQPILEPLIQGRRSTLGAPQQVIAANWATKTLLLLQRTHKDDKRSIPDREYRWFRDHRWPLENEQVWIGRYDGTGDWPVAYHHYAFELFNTATGKTVDSPDESHGYAVAFSVGYLFFRAFGHTIKNGPKVMPGGPFAGILRQIWPTTGESVGWPPRISIPGDDGMHETIAVLDRGFAADR
jgi:hypothetical protein